MAWRLDAWQTPPVSESKAPAASRRTAVELSRALLESPPTPPADQPKRRWAYGVVGLVLASAFIAYHTIVLLTWNTPSGGLGKKFHSTVIAKTFGRRYFTATSNTQSWSMFAPNPNRTNVFIRVLVEDQDGEIWDMGHDIWEVDRFPYLWYDRMGKVNRRIDGKKGYQKSYGAWICRQWAMEHDGEMPVAVKFVKRWTKIPRPEEVIKRSLATGNWGYNPWKLKNRQKEQERVVCKKTVNAQLTNEMRARHGLAQVDDDGFKPVRIRTWWDKQQAEKRREEAKKKAAERSARLTERPPGRTGFVPRGDDAGVRVQPAKPTAG